MNQHRLPQHIVRHLEEARESAMLTRANFDGLAMPNEVNLGKDEVTDFIKNRVKLHHDTWIIGPIDSILEWSQTVDDGSQKEWDILGRLRAPFPNPAVLEQAYEEIKNLRKEVAELRNFKFKTQEALKALGGE